MSPKRGARDLTVPNVQFWSCRSPSWRSKLIHQPPSNLGPNYTLPSSIPSGITREHVLRALSDLDRGGEHPFGKATGYELVHAGKRYAPKAVIGLSCRYSMGRLLQPEEFSGGEAPGQANFVLRKLGFSVLPIGIEDPEPQAGKDWSEDEVLRVVADYFAMLESEMAGEAYNKSDHRKALLPSLSNRSERSIELTHQNVSGVLVEMGQPYIEGYKPRFNYQAILAQEVERFLDDHPDLCLRLAEATRLNPKELQAVHSTRFDQLIEAPPERLITSRSPAKPWLTRKARKVDFAERDAANRRLGTLGEQFVFDFEKYRLNQAGRDDLASKVTWASRDIGDGLGFDILSFDATDESERMLEVKATGLGKFSPFYVSANEVRCSEDIPNQYQLFRVFDFGKTPRIYILHGSLRELCQLEPVLYRAVV